MFKNPNKLKTVKCKRCNKSWEIYYTLKGVWGEALEYWWPDIKKYRNELRATCTQCNEFIKNKVYR